MRGNSYFDKFEEESVWNSKVAKLLNTETGDVPLYKEKEYNENPHFVRDVLTKELEEALKIRDFMDTKVNASYSPLHKMGQKPQKKEEWI